MTEVTSQWTGSTDPDVLPGLRLLHLLLLQCFSSLFITFVEVRGAVDTSLRTSRFGDHRRGPYRSCSRVSWSLSQEGVSLRTVSESKYVCLRLVWYFSETIKVVIVVSP